MSKRAAPKYTTVQLKIIEEATHIFELRRDKHFPKYVVPLPLRIVKENSCNAWHKTNNTFCTRSPSVNTRTIGYLPVCPSHMNTYKLIAGRCRYTNAGVRCNKLLHWAPPEPELCSSHRGWDGLPDRLTQLPAEVRQMILGYILPNTTICASSIWEMEMSCLSAVLQVNKQLNADATTLLYLNPFELVISLDGFDFCGKSFAFPRSGPLKCDPRRSWPRELTIPEHLLRVRKLNLTIQFMEFQLGDFACLLEGVRAMTLFLKGYWDNWKSSASSDRSDDPVLTLELPTTTTNVNFTHSHHEENGASHKTWEIENSRFLDVKKVLEDRAASSLRSRSSLQVAFERFTTVAASLHESGYLPSKLFPGIGNPKDHWRQARGLTSVSAIDRLTRKVLKAAELLQIEDVAKAKVRADRYTDTKAWFMEQADGRKRTELTDSDTKGVNDQTEGLKRKRSRSDVSDN
ncbi:hypothetical protein BT63DRAFT_456431 [Microthyrium microscopicum]|uniref:Probable treble clef zinc finger fungi domain-containing protein n=1 Tax=Microthyrium microscopicum TaxID=703497 RepID=A0A6A6UB19_9PEZI|nr:hypothetical protein BT63DRAFT_456431 [Microthyrium microscopicum]